MYILFHIMYILFHIRHALFHIRHALFHISILLYAHHGMRVGLFPNAKRSAHASRELAG